MSAFKKKFRITALLVIALSLLTGGTAYYFDHRHHITAGFKLSKISASLPSRPEWELPVLSEVERQEVNTALQQNYRYLGKGMQCWAFVSEDQRYVLKFFYHQRLHAPKWLDYFPMRYLFKEYRQKKKRQKKELLERTFASYKLAFEQLREETGLLYVQLNANPANDYSLRLFDKSGAAYLIDLKQQQFILQRRADLIIPTLSTLMQQGNTQQAKLLLNSAIETLVKRCQKGIRDCDPYLYRNGGFIDDHLILIDSGQLEYDEKLKEPMVYKEYLRCQLLKGLLPALENYPELVKHVHQQIDRL